MAAIRNDADIILQAASSRFINEDNILSGGIEKQNLRAQWQIIADEEPKLVAQAALLGVSSTAYVTAFQALANYLNNGTTWSSGIPTWIADANLGSDTAITGSTLRINLTAYTGARADLNNALAAKSSTYFSTNDAVALGFNPTFSAWSGTYPDNWSALSGAAPVKESTIKRVGNYSVKYVCTGVDCFMSNAISAGSLGATNVISGTVDFYLGARTSGLPGIMIGLKDASNNWLSWEYVQPTLTTLGVWQRKAFTIRGDGVTAIATIIVYIMGSSTALPSGPFTGTAYIDNFQFTIQQGSVFDNLRQSATDITVGTLGGVNIDLSGSARFNGTYTISGVNYACSAGDAGTRQGGVYGKGTQKGVAGETSGNSNTTYGGYFAGWSNSVGCFGYSDDFRGTVGQSQNGSGIEGIGATSGAIGVRCTNSAGGVALYADGAIKTTQPFTSGANTHNSLTNCPTATAFWRWVPIYDSAGTKWWFPVMRDV